MVAFSKPCRKISKLPPHYQTFFFFQCRKNKIKDKYPLLILNPITWEPPRLLIVKTTNLTNLNIMELNEIITQLKDKFGDKIDVTKVTEMLKGSDHSNMSLTDIIAKIKDGGLLGDLDGDGVKEGFVEEIKGKASEMLGGLGHMFGK